MAPHTVVIFFGVVEKVLGCFGPRRVAAGRFRRLTDLGGEVLKQIIA